MEEELDALLVWIRKNFPDEDAFEQMHLLGQMVTIKIDPSHYPSLE